MSESDVHRCQILTYIDGPRAERTETTRGVANKLVRQRRARAPGEAVIITPHCDHTRVLMDILCFWWGVVKEKIHYLGEKKCLTIFLFCIMSYIKLWLEPGYVVITLSVLISIFYISTHLNLCLATAIHSFKWIKNSYPVFSYFRPSISSYFYFNTHQKSHFIKQLHNGNNNNPVGSIGLPLQSWNICV